MYGNVQLLEEDDERTPVRRGKEMPSDTRNRACEEKYQREKSDGCGTANAQKNVDARRGRRRVRGVDGDAEETVGVASHCMSLSGATHGKGTIQVILNVSVCE